MASKRRIRRRGCTGKIRHETQGGAFAHLRSLHEPGLNVYRCRFCRGYHVGHRGERYGDT